MSGLVKRKDLQVVLFFRRSQSVCWMCAGDCREVLVSYLSIGAEGDGAVSMGL